MKIIVINLTYLQVIDSLQVHHSSLCYEYVSKKEKEEKMLFVVEITC